jgi:predicted nucleic acid-binding protein
MIGDFVVDCSVALAWYLEDEQNAYTESVLHRLTTQKPIVPDLFFLEATNALLAAQHRSRITSTQVDEFLATLNALPFIIDHGCSRGFLFDILSLARTHKLSAYDAAYLELARREHLPLATQDAALTKAAKAARVKLLL